MGIRFQVKPTPAEVFPWQCGEAQFEIGRGATCKLRFEGDAATAVSGRHALVEVTPLGGFLTDLRSTNGTYLNGNRVTERMRLSVGDQIQLGQSGPRLEVLALEVPPVQPVLVAREIPSAQPGPTTSVRRNAMLWIATGVASVLLVAGIAVRLFDRNHTQAVVANTPPAPPAPVAPAPQPKVEPTKPEPAPAPEPAAPAVPAIEKKPWREAGVVLVDLDSRNKPQRAVAIDAQGNPPAYRVLAKLGEDAAPRAAEVAWDSGVPFIVDEHILTRKIYDDVNPGDLLAKGEINSLSQKWREFNLVPANGVLTVFNDLNVGRTRLGYLAPAREFDPAKGEETWFRDVASKTPEAFLQKYVQRGSQRKGIDDDVLLKTPGVDFLHYCLLHLANALSIPSEKRGVLNVCVVGDVSKIAMPEKRHDVTLFNTPHDFRIRAEADRLTRESERLASELRGHLIAMGVPLAEWSKEMKLGSYESDFRRPDFKDAQEGKLLGISHVLIFRVRTPETRGMYELSMRLIDMKDGRNVCEAQHDRLKPEPVFDLAAAPYLISTGTLTLLQLSSEHAIIDESTRAWSRGGLPLVVPPIRLKSEPAPSKLKHLAQKPLPKRPWHHKFNHPDEMWGQADRLGFVEKETDSSVVYRDLFSAQSQTLPLEAISGALPITTDKAIPPAHILRYLVWSVAKLILPTGGRVTAVGNGVVKTSLRKEDRIEERDRLTVIRPASASSEDVSASETILPQELTVKSVSNVDSVAIVEELEGADAKDATPIQVGDIVHRKPERKMVIAVLKPQVNMGAAPAMGVSTSKSPNDYMDAKEYTQYVGGRLSQILQNGLVKLGVESAERNDLESVLNQQQSENFDTDLAKKARIGRIAGATHLVLIEISPGLYWEAPVNLRVVTTDNAIVVGQLDFTFKKAQLEAWSP